MKTNKKLKFTAVLVVAFVALLLLILKPAYLYRPIQYQKQTAFPLSEKDSLYFGHSKFSLLLDMEQYLAGYGNRGAFEQVIDTPYFQVFALQSGKKQLFICLADLLIFPPELYGSIMDGIDKLGLDKDQFYFGASHSHHSIGGWAMGLGGRANAGVYNEAQMEIWKDAALASIKKAHENKQPAQWASTQQTANQWIMDRLAKSASDMNELKAWYFQLADSSMYILSSYSAHPTTIPSDESVLSNDYPGFMRKHLMAENPKIKEVGFMAGAVGCAGPKLPRGKSIANSETMGSSLAEIILHEEKGLVWNPVISLGSSSSSINLPDAAPRLSAGWHLRPWIFKLLMGSYDLPIQIAQLDKHILLAYPVDFSSVIAKNIIQNTEKEGFDIWFSSFSGGYAGYIVSNEQYQKYTNAECREMNWSGPYAADYFWDFSHEIIRAQEMQYNNQFPQ